MEHRLAKHLLGRYDQQRSSQTRTGPDCPDENSWAKLADRLLSPSEREALIEHISRCPSCRRTAGEILSEWPVSGEYRPPMVFRLRWGIVAAAAGVLLVVGIYSAITSRGPAGTDLLAQARRNFDLGQYHQVRVDLDRLLSDAKTRPAEQASARSLYEQSYVASARAKMERKDYTGARAELTEAMDRGYQSADVLGLRGQALLATAVATGPVLDGRLTGLGFVGVLDRRTKSVPATMPESETNQAIDLLREATALQAESPARWRELGQAMLSIHRYADAIEPFEHWCRLRPNDAAAYNALGMARYAAERYAEAVVAFEEAVRLQPTMAAYELNAALACEEAGRLHDAVGHWKHYLQLDPQGAQSEEVRKWLAILERGLQ